MKVSGKMVKEMVQVFVHFQMVTHMKANGKMMNDTVKENVYILTAKFISELGKII